MRIRRAPPRPPAPFLKWVGGKGKLVKVLKGMLPKGVERMQYVEPFIGGGAFFFALQPRAALVCDRNSDLVHTYSCVKNSLPELVKVLAKLASLHSVDPEGTYYAVRDQFNHGNHGTVGRAARFIYLNRTCFNGVYRVNKRGEFNVPMGRYANPTILDLDTLRAARWALKRARLDVGTFDATLQDVGKGSFVYLDPPYEPVSKTANFTAFTKEGFTHVDQVSLFDIFGKLHRRGAKVMQSNSDTPLVRRLYAGYDVREVQAARAVNSKASARGDVTELVIRNYT